LITKAWLVEGLASVYPQRAIQVAREAIVEHSQVMQRMSNEWSSEMKIQAIDAFFRCLMVVSGIEEASATVLTRIEAVPPEDQQLLRHIVVASELRALVSKSAFPEGVHGKLLSGSVLRSMLRIGSDHPEVRDLLDQYYDGDQAQRPDSLVELLVVDGLSTEDTFLVVLDWTKQIMNSQGERGRGHDESLPGFSERDLEGIVGLLVPILWHIMKIYSSFGIHEFIICAGYKGYMIKEYFSNYFLHMSDVTFDMGNNTVEVLHKKAEPWRVTVVDTGEATMTGGRLKRVERFLGQETFCMTYGDGVADINIEELIAFHRRTGAAATLTAVQPPGRYGALSFTRNDPNRISLFQEKPEGDGAWVNGGFFVLEPSAIDYIEQGDRTVWEREPLANLAASGMLSAYRHRGFWLPMDTLRDRNELQQLWENGKAPWKVWDK